MQVSWIDADHLQSLLAQIAPPETCADVTPQTAVELEAMPGFMDEAAADLPHPAPEPVAAPAPLSCDAPMLDESPADESAQTEEEEYHGKPLHNSAAALPLSRIRDKLRAIRQRATEAGILTRTHEPLEASANVEPESNLPVSLETLAAAAPLQAMAAFQVPQGSRMDRLAAFSAWARQVLHESGGHVLVMSDDGEVLWGGDVKAGLVLSTMMAWSAAIRGNAASAFGTTPVMRKPLSSGHVLTVIPCETKAGIFHAAVAAPEGLTDALAAALRDALRDTMNADGGVIF